MHFDALGEAIKVLASNLNYFCRHLYSKSEKCISHHSSYYFARREKFVYLFQVKTFDILPMHVLQNSLYKRKFIFSIHQLL
jgi:hypothetical protein